jgi:hypothetical protein
MRLKKTHTVRRISDFQSYTKKVQILTKQSGTFSSQLLPFLALTFIFSHWLSPGLGLSTSKGYFIFE